MVYYREKEIDDAFFALSHPVRRAMLDRLSAGHSSVNRLAAPFDLSPAQTTKHLAILERGGLVKRTKVGRSHQLSLRTDVLEEIEQWLQQYQRFWNNRLDALDRFLANEQKPEDKT